MAKSREQRKSLGPALFVLVLGFFFFPCDAMLSLLGSSLVSVTSWKQRINYKKTQRFAEVWVVMQVKSSAHNPVLSLLMGNQELEEICLVRICEMIKLEKKVKQQETISRGRYVEKVLFWTVLEQC